MFWLTFDKGRLFPALRDVALPALSARSSPSQTLDLATQEPITDAEAARERSSGFVVGALLAGAALGTAAGTAMAGSLGVLVGLAVGSVVGAIGGKAAWDAAVLRSR